MPITMFSKKMFRLIFHESDFSLKLFICKVAVVQQKQKTLLRLREHDFLVFFTIPLRNSDREAAAFKAPRMLQACERFSIPCTIATVNEHQSAVFPDQILKRESQTQQELRRASDGVLCKCAFRYRATFSVCCFDGTIFRV